MAETIRRGGARPVRRQGRSQPAVRKPRSGGAKHGSLADALARVLPFTEHQLHKVFLLLILLGVAGVALFIASLAGLPQTAGKLMAEQVGEAGFEVRRVEVRGARQMNEIAVYERVLGVHDRAMPLVSLGELRASLIELPWVRDARVSRQLPDTIVVDIVERQPHAVLRTGTGLALIDNTGHIIEPVRAAEARKRRVIAGEGAQSQVAALARLLEAAPELRGRVREAEWVGRRRWNLTFATGQVLSLPQGEEQSRVALAGFARLDGTNRLLGGRVASFDMRNPDRIYLRVPGRAEEATAAAAAKKDS